MRRFVFFTAALGAIAGGGSASAAQPAAEFVTGIEYQQGDYGIDQQLETLTIRSTARVQSGGAQFYLSLPWHRIEGPGNVVAGGGLLGVPILTDPDRPAGRSARQGIGDLRVGASYALAAPAEIDLSLLGEAKLPTASARRGLGTGAADFTLGGEAARTFGAVTPFFGISYTFVGDPDGDRLDNSLAARGGIAVRLSSMVRGHVSYGQARGLSPFIENERQLSTGIDAQLSQRLSLGISGGAGLTQGAPDLGAAVRLGWRLF